MPSLSKIKENFANTFHIFVPSEQLEPSSLARTRIVLIVVSVTTVATLFLHLLRLNTVIDSDEYFYKTAALTIINHSPCGPLSYLASLQPCNLEHPPFAKVLMAASILVFGPGNLGVRLPSIISGVLSVPAIAWLVWSLSGGSAKTTLAASILLAASPTWFLLSSVGMLDSTQLFLGILALAVYFSKIGRQSVRDVLSGVLFGLSILSKEVGVLFLAGIVIYELLFGRPRRLLYPLIFSALTIFAGLWIYDLIFTPFSNPLQHVLFIVDTGLRLRYQGGFLLSPLKWFFQPREVILVALFFLWVPAALLMIRGKRQQRKSSEGLLPISLVLLLVTLVPPTILFYLNHRQEYLFYEVQVLPALVLGASGFLGWRRAPWYALLAAVVASMYLFAFYFPSLLSVYF